MQVILATNALFYNNIAKESRRKPGRLAMLTAVLAVLHRADYLTFIMIFR